MKKFSVATLALLTFLATGCSQPIVKSAKTNIILSQKPISKVCIEHTEGKRGMTELEPIISEAVSELGYRTEIFGSHNEDKPSVDCSHIVTYQVKKKGHTVKKFSTDFYLYSPEDIKRKRIGKAPEDIKRKRIGKALDKKGFNTIDKDDVKDKLKDIYYRIISE